MRIKRRHLVAALVAGLLGKVCVAAAADPVSAMVVFGDSLSDPGNAFVLQRENNVPPDYSLNPLLIPDDAYARGGHHFSNGPVWAEQLGRSLGLAADAGPAFRDANTHATNYAVGGARANDDGTNINLPVQVRVFLQDFGGHAPSDALYVIAFGGNDVRDALAAAGAGQDPAPVIGAGVGAVGTNIRTLYLAGARRFLVWNVPNLGLTPAVQALGPGAVSAAGQLSKAFNDGLGAVLAVLVPQLPGITITGFDLGSVLDAVHGDPAAFNLRDVTHPCISPRDPPFVCKYPDTYLYWDGIHPTTAAHGIIARDIARLLGN
jgi:phospholipase/lecithinase/hemolysin